MKKVLVIRTFFGLDAQTMVYKLRMFFINNKNRWETNLFKTKNYFNDGTEKI